MSLGCSHLYYGVVGRGDKWVESSCSLGTGNERKTGEEAEGLGVR